MQISLHSITQTILPTSGAKSFAMKSIGEQAKEFRERKGWNYTEMAAEVQKHFRDGQVNRQKITQLEQAGARRPQYLGALAKAMGTTVEELEAGRWKPAPESAPPPEPSNVADAPALAPSRLVPVVGHVKGGDDGYLEEMLFPVGHGEGFVPYWTKDSSAYALRVRGDSMHPRYRAREFVVVTPSIEAQQGNDVVVRMKDGRKLLKQLNWNRDGEVQLLSINNGFAPMTIQMSDVESIHRVAGGVPPDAFQET